MSETYDQQGLEHQFSTPRIHGNLFIWKKTGSLQRIGIEGIKKHPWFSQSYESDGHSEEEEVNLDDVRAVFYEIEVGIITFKLLFASFKFCS